MGAASAALAAAPLRHVYAQDEAKNYPSRPIRLIVGFAAGGGNDIFARLVGQKFSEFIGQPVVIENRPGAGGRLSAAYVAAQAADGYTLLVGAAGAMAVAPAIYPNLSYHPLRSFVPLTLIGAFPLVLNVSAKHGVKTVAEMVAWAKAHPDKANYATSAPGPGLPPRDRVPHAETGRAGRRDPLKGKKRGGAQRNPGPDVAAPPGPAA